MTYSSILPHSRKLRRATLLTATAALLAACSAPPSAPPKSTTGYRQEAARHLYALNTQRIYQGKLPPLLYAVGVLQLDINRQGRIDSLHWLRKPTHAPEVVREIERSVRAAQPFPIPTGTARYTETWLWDQSGKFQLDTLSEGQLSQ